MQNELAQRYFELIRNAWLPVSGSRRIIPFCTPVFSHPTAIVIGTNHSDFVLGGGSQSENIADQLASKVPTESTFLVHDHKFAKGMRAVCERAQLEIDDTWIGTNRCAVQTGPDGINELNKLDAFESCQRKMDEILREFIREVKPRNVILVGKYAIRLYGPQFGRNNLRVTDLSPLDLSIAEDGPKIRIIPIQHPSRATYWKNAASSLSQHFVVDGKNHL